MSRPRIKRAACVRAEEYGALFSPEQLEGLRERHACRDASTRREQRRPEPLAQWGRGTIRRNVEILTHTDRRGRAWRFGIDCTRHQYEAIRGALAAVRNMGNRAGLGLPALMDAERNGALFADIEAAMLQGLAQRFPEPQQGTRQARPMRPPNAVLDEADADEAAPGYWWEKL